MVVNCTGLGARELVPDAGYGRCAASWSWWRTRGSTSGSPRWIRRRARRRTPSQPGGLLLGGTADADDSRTAPDPRTAQEIVARCARVRPEIAGARVTGHRVGLRPARDGGVRIEAVPRPGNGLLVHNYGHGGAGVTVALGCARAAAQLVG
ncbi:FAD-dependent oxidoreductase [Streptomyces sp. M10(2022)]